MANVIVASNASGMSGKWLPYYFKPFNLGTSDDSGAGSTDARQYIHQSSGSSEHVKGICISDYNCAFWYTMKFESVSGANCRFVIRKYRISDDGLEDIIYASSLSGMGRFWQGLGSYDNISYSIDIGVIVHFPDASGFTVNDTFVIKLPTAEQMGRRKIYHGGYSTFIRMPYTEDIAFHSDIIPTNLHNKNITVIFNPPVGIGLYPKRGLQLSLSAADVGGNEAVSIFIEWNTDPDGSSRDTAGSDSATDYTWASNESWLLGSIFASDLDPHTEHASDFPALGHASAGNVWDGAEAQVTGTIQSFNTTVSARAGHAKIKAAYLTGSGGPSMGAHNQFWPIILLIS